MKVKSAITRVSRGSPLNGTEAMAVVGLIKYADALQVTLKTAVKEDSEWYSRFVPITPMVNLVYIILLVNMVFICILKIIFQCQTMDGK